MPIIIMPIGFIQFLAIGRVHSLYYVLLGYFYIQISIEKYFTQMVRTHSGASD